MLHWCIQGYLGIPEGGFPEPFRSHVLQDRRLPNGKSMFDGRPGAEMAELNFASIENEMREKFGENVREVDLMSYVMYPKVGRYALYNDIIRFIM